MRHWGVHVTMSAGPRRVFPPPRNAEGQPPPEGTTFWSPLHEITEEVLNLTELRFSLRAPRAVVIYVLVVVLVVLGYGQYLL